MLEIDRLHHTFRLRSGAFGHRPLVALHDVSFRVRDGSTVALVGESGSGKSTLGRCVVRLLQPTGGEIRLGGVPVSRLSAADFRPYRRKLQMVFQDPDESLNPRMTVGETLREPLRLRRDVHGREMAKQVSALLEQVQLSPHFADRLPHQLSGGQQQRVGIARALAAEPELVVLDEPSSALDVSVRAQILNLLLDLQSVRGVGYLLISHDLFTVRYMASEVVILYLGQVMERGPVETVFHRPQHPYTRGLLAAAPRVKRARTDGHAMLKGEAGNAPLPGQGCPLAPRCPQAIERCFVTPQRLIETEPGHEVACSVETGVWT